MKLTAKQRKTIYAVVPPVIAVLIAFNVVSTAQIKEFVSTLGLVGGALTTLLAYANTDPNQDVDNTDDAVGGTDD